MTGFPSDDGANAAANRPRRPNPETISYLISLPIDEKACHDQVQEYLERKADMGHANDDFPPLLGMALSALDEIRNELASLAGHERGAQITEQLFRMVLPHSPSAVRLCWHGLTGYHLHLATHRYGSHVVQTLMEMSGRNDGIQDLAQESEGPETSLSNLKESNDDNDDDGTLPSLEELLMCQADELSPVASSLAIHVCGSHVLRSLVCLLGGVELVYGQSFGPDNGSNMSQRGKNKSKKKKKKKRVNPDGDGSFGEGQDRGGGGGGGASVEIRLRYPSSAHARVSDTTRAVLAGLMENLWLGDDIPASNLQEMAVHPSAGPLFIICLRVLAYLHCDEPTKWQDSPTSEGGPEQQAGPQSRPFRDRLARLQPEPQFVLDSPCDRLVRKLLCLDDKDNQSGNVLYELAGEIRGSRVLETVFCIVPDAVHSELLERGAFLESASDYVEHNVANFVYQTILATARTQEQSNALLRAVEKAITTGYVLDPKYRRRGILWRLAEMVATHRVGQENFLKMLRLGMGVILNKARDSHDDNGDGDHNEDSIAKGESGQDRDVGDTSYIKKKKRHKSNSVPLRECVPPLLRIVAPQKDGDRLSLDPAGARVVYHLLQFAPRLCKDVLVGITEELTAAELELLAKDGLGSRWYVKWNLGKRIVHSFMSLCGYSHSGWVPLTMCPLPHTYLVSTTLPISAIRFDVPFLSFPSLSVHNSIMDPILDGPTQEKEFSTACRQLLDRLSGRWIALASDRVGHHTVKKLFRALPLNDKTKLVSELSRGGNRLSGSSMGRAIAEACSLSDFLLLGESDWKALIKRRQQKETWLQEIITEGEDQQGQDQDGDQDGQGPKKRTRKRKRKKKEDTNDTKETGTAKSTKLDTTAAIMEAIDPTR